MWSTAVGSEGSANRHISVTGAVRLFQELRQFGLIGRYSPVTVFVRDWRVSAGTVLANTGFVTLKFVAGGAFQIDWRKEGLLIGSR